MVSHDSLVLKVNNLQFQNTVYLVVTIKTLALLGHRFFIPNNLTKLGCQFLGLCLLQLVDAGCGFGTHDATSPVTTDLENEFDKGFKWCNLFFDINMQF